MFGLPTGTVYLVDNKGEKHNVMMSDITSEEELKHEVEYLFNKCGYKKDNFQLAIYVENNKTIYTYKLDLI